MAQALKWSRVGWGNLSCPLCHGILDYIYATWFRCRACDGWCERKL